MNCHILKTWPESFDQVHRGEKTAEFRKNDRDFKVGDFLMLREWKPDADEYTGRRLIANIGCITTGFGIPDGYVMLSLRDMAHCTEGHSFNAWYQ